MASSYTSNSGIEKPAEGDQTGEWGDTVNTNMDIIDRSINGVGAITLSGTTHTLTTTDGTLSDGMYKVLVLGGSPSGTNTITISPNDQDKVYIVVNGSGQTATFTQGSGGNVSVLNGDSKIIYADGNGTGAAVVDITANLSFSSVNIDGGTIDGTVIGGASAAAGTFTTVTASGEIDGASLDISGNADIDGTLEADAMTLNGTAITTTATLSTGISNTNVPVFTTGVADDDFLRVAGTSIEGRSAAEVLSDIGASAAAGSGSIVTTGALDSGSITSGFGTINNGSSAITTTGLISGGSLDIDDVVINGSTIGHTDDTDLITVANGVATVAGEVSMTTLDIGGTNVTSTATELNKLDGATVTTTEINYLDITTLGTSEASKAVTVDSSGDLIVPDSDKFKFGAGSDMQLYHDGTNSYITNGTGILKIATETSGIALTIGHGTSEVTFGDNVTVTGDFTVNGTTTTINTTNLTVTDPLVKYGQGYTGTAYDEGFIITRGNGSATNTANKGFIWDESADEFAAIACNTEDGTTAGNVTINSYADLQVDKLTGGSLDISGDADIDGTLEADAMTLNGTAITTTATLSTGISNTNVPVFTSGVADDDFLRVAGTSIEGRSAAEVLSDIGASAVAGSSSIVTTGALNSGSITSGFGTINNGSSTITTSGVVTSGSLLVGDAGTIGSASDTDAVAISSAGQVSFSATNAIKVPVGTTAQRPSNAAGLIRYNSTLGQFEGYTSAWGGLGGGATGGGADQVFVENSDDVTTNYTITSGKNAMSVGPITVESGVVVTIPSGSRWVVL
jgi:cytoskeletal protein CcmA (bactofilin family)